MMHGDVVTVTRDGIRLSQDALSTVGIFEGAQCWGVSLPGQGDKGPGYGENERHLIVAPIPPKSWPFLIRVKLFLSSRPGTVAKASEVLSRNGLNSSVDH